VGEYSFLALPVGHYGLEVKASGFREYTQTDIALNANDALRLDVLLEVGQTTESVEVKAAAAHVETTNTQVGDVIVGGTMEALPLNGRSYTDLLGLQPGVVPVSTGAVGNTAGGNLSIAGQRETSNGFEINGSSVEEARNNGAGVVPNLDAIAEFRVITNNADAEYGHYNGGLINVVTKSGTNDFHGSGFEFLRNEKLELALIGKLIGSSPAQYTYTGPLMTESGAKGAVSPVPTADSNRCTISGKIGDRDHDFRNAYYFLLLVLGGLPTRKLQFLETCATGVRVRTTCQP
jgi:hypothetical protein